MVFLVLARCAAVVCGLVLLPACAQTPMQAGAQPPVQAAPSPTPSSPVPPALVGRYIVLLQPEVADVQAAAEALTRGIPGARVHQVYTRALKGFSASVPAVALDALRRHPDVHSIEPDQPVQAYPAAPGRP